MESHYTLFGSRLSYFTRKLETALDWYGAPYRYKARTADDRESLQARAGTHQIPVLQTPENWMIADTTPIIQLLDARFASRALFPDGPLGVLVHIVEEYFDEWIPRTAVHYRWHYDESAQQAASTICDELLPAADESARKAVSATMSDWGTRACRATGTESEVQQRIAETELERVLQALETQLDETPFALGTRPCAVDAVVLGALRAHFATDPVPRRVVERFPNVLRWSDDAAWSGQGDLAAFPASTAFARFVLAEMVLTYRPYILGNAGALERVDKSFKIEIQARDGELSNPRVSGVLEADDPTTCQWAQRRLSSAGAQVAARRAARRLLRQLAPQRVGTSAIRGSGASRSCAARSG